MKKNFYYGWAWRIKKQGIRILHPAHTRIARCPAGWLWSAWSWVGADLWELWPFPLSVSPLSLLYWILQGQTPSPPPSLPPSPSLHPPPSPPPSPCSLSLGLLPLLSPCCLLCPLHPSPPQLRSSLPGRPDKEKNQNRVNRLLIISLDRFMTWLKVF